MPYTPLIHPDAIGSQANPFARSPAINDLLSRCYGSDILPARGKHLRFRRNEIFGDLYLSERNWVDEVDFATPDGRDRHEGYLDHLFWDDTARTPLICLLGPVGSGKSTLIDYYLRCHCPTNGRRRADFDKKLIVHFDAKVIQDNTDFYHDFFLYAQSSVRYQCAHRDFDIDGAIKRRATQPNNVREWVWAAFEELSRVGDKDARPAPFQYIALVVDNLDQTPPPVQIRAITEVEQWLLTPTIRLWRVFLPLWPSTHAYLRNHRFNLLRNAFVFRIGPIDTRRLIANHERAVATELTRFGATIDRQAIDYLTDITQLARDRLLSRIEGLSYGSLRQSLALWDGLLRSELAYSLWRQAQAAPESRRGYEYELLDALIVGAHRAMSPRDHRIANLFGMGHAFAHPRDILIGAHAMHLLERGDRTRQALTDMLGGLGYSSHNVEHVIEVLGAFNVLHQVPARGASIEFELHDSVIDEYLQLLAEPAYVDNIAMVTPVDPAYLPAMRPTRGDRPDDFTARVETTLNFLRFLRDCEVQFRDPSRLRAGLDPARFREKLEAARLPCLWRRIALRYRGRLEGLRHSGYLRNVDAAWWDRTLHNPLLTTQLDAEGELLTSS